MGNISIFARTVFWLTVTTSNVSLNCGCTRTLFGSVRYRTVFAPVKKNGVECGVMCCIAVEVIVALMARLHSIVAIIDPYSTSRVCVYFSDEKFILASLYSYGIILGPRTWGIQLYVVKSVIQNVAAIWGGILMLIVFTNQNLSLP